jgi:hypothetical protein
MTDKVMSAVCHYGATPSFSRDATTDTFHDDSETVAFSFLVIAVPSRIADRS